MTSHVLSLDNTPARLDRNDARDRPWVVVALSGDLDIAATRPLAELDAVVADNPGSRVLVDLTNVTFIDSAALRVFTRTMETAAAGGGLLSLHGASDRASRLLQLWHLEPEPGATRHASSHAWARATRYPARAATRQENADERRVSAPRVPVQQSQD